MHLNAPVLRLYDLPECACAQRCVTRIRLLTNTFLALFTEFIVQILEVLLNKILPLNHDPAVADQQVLVGPPRQGQPLLAGGGKTVGKQLFFESFIPPVPFKLVEFEPGAGLVAFLFNSEHRLVVK